MCALYFGPECWVESNVGRCGDDDVLLGDGGWEYGSALILGGDWEYESNMIVRCHHWVEEMESPHLLYWLFVLLLRG